MVLSIFKKDSGRYFDPHDEKWSRFDEGCTYLRQLHHFSRPYTVMFFRRHLWEKYDKIQYESAENIFIGFSRNDISHKRASISLKQLINTLHRSLCQLCRYAQIPLFHTRHFWINFITIIINFIYISNWACMKENNFYFSVRHVLCTFVKPSEW